jgi:hypothetical protein
VGIAGIAWPFLVVVAAEKEEKNGGKEEEQRRLFLLGCSFTISLSSVWPTSSTIQMALQLPTGVVSPSLALHRGRWLGRLPGGFSHPGAALCALSSINVTVGRGLATETLHRGGLPAADAAWLRSPGRRRNLRARPRRSLLFLTTHGSRSLL